MTSQTPVAVGVPWYRRADYHRLRKLFRDGHKLPDTYDAWLKAAKRVLDQARANGQLAVKAVIDPDEFPDWCRANGLDVDGEARRRYANLIAMQHYRSLS